MFSCLFWTATVLLNDLPLNFKLLRQNYGHAKVDRVEYRKSRTFGGHEYLMLTVTETLGAGRTVYLLAGKLDDDPPFSFKWLRSFITRIVTNIAHCFLLPVVPSVFFASPVLWIFRSSSMTSPSPAVVPANQWATSNSAHRASANLKAISKMDPPDAFDIQNRHPYNVLMTMNLSSLQVPITKHFLALVKTTSDSTPLYHLVYSQCFWYAYTIWAVLALEAGAHVDLLDRANRQGTHFFFGRNLSFGRGDGVHHARKPETIKEEWEKIKAVVDREFKAALQVSLTVILQKSRP